MAILLALFPPVDNNKPVYRYPMSMTSAGEMKGETKREWQFNI